MLSVRKCKNCGKDFQRTLETKGRRCCSDECAKASWAASYKGTVGSWLDRFFDGICFDGPIIVPELGPCWQWTRGRSKDVGYGKIDIDGETNGTHCVSWELFVGSIPVDLWVLHHCDNPPCVNPAHLKLGTAADNTADMMRRGRCRGYVNQGEGSPNVKLTDEQVIEIRRRRAAGDTYRVLAEAFGVCQARCHQIVNGKAWLHLASADVDG
jgi:hypothetical protein